MVDCTRSSSRPHWKVGQYLVESSLIWQSNYLTFPHHLDLPIRPSWIWQLIKGWMTPTKTGHSARVVWLALRSGNSRGAPFQRPTCFTGDIPDGRKDRRQDMRITRSSSSFTSWRSLTISTVFRAVAQKLRGISKAWKKSRHFSGHAAFRPIRRLSYKPQHRKPPPENLKAKRLRQDVPVPRLYSQHSSLYPPPPPTHTICFMDNNISQNFSYAVTSSPQGTVQYVKLINWMYDINNSTWQ
jgi:hypothetical protein